MPANPDVDVAGELNTQVGDLTLGTNLFIGKLPEKGDNIPSVCAACLLMGGELPLAYGGGGTTAETYSGVQVLVRGANDGYEAGRTLAKSVYDTLNFATATMTTYAEVRCDQSEPLYLGQDSARHHLWSINVTLIHER